MLRPCYGGCGKLVPESKVHCGDKDCEQKTYLDSVTSSDILSADSATKKKPGHGVKLASVALLAAYRKAVQARMLAGGKVRRKKAA